MKYYELLTGFCFLSNFIYAEPPRSPPIELLSGFTMDGKIPMIDFYIDGTFKDGDVSCFYLKADIDGYIEQIQRKEVGYYGETDVWLYQALEAYPIKGKDVLIIGSNKPWYESMVIAYGGNPITIDYNKIITDDVRLIVMTVEEFNKSPKKVDIVFSISSIEHDGLGRYGDPLNPIADLEFMLTCSKKYLKPDGHMILAVPVGEDCIAWNAHRIYGRHRLPLLINSWNIIATFGFSEEDYWRGLGDCGHQPIFYLSPKNDLK